MPVLTFSEIEAIVKPLLRRYNAESAILFGSYARGEATKDSDIDLIVIGGEHFLPRNIFAPGKTCAPAPAATRTCLGIRLPRSSKPIPRAGGCS